MMAGRLIEASVMQRGGELTQTPTAPIPKSFGVLQPSAS
jgi:hypothetical protein